MRYSFFLVFIFYVMHSAFSQNNRLLFSKLPFDQVLKQAKFENKPLFLYFYFDGCGACIQLEKKVFADTVFTKFLNENFVCCKINAKKGDGIEISKIYNARSFPTVVICDTSESILGKNIGFLATDEFLSFCERAINRSTSLAGMRDIYKQGDRSAKFLYDYCFQLYSADEADSLSINEYLLTQNPDQLRSKDNIQFIYTLAVTGTKSNFDMSSPAFELLNKHPELFYPYYDTTQVKGRIVWITAQNFQNAFKEKDSRKMQKCLMVLADYISTNYYRVNDVNGVFKSIIFYTPNDYLVNKIFYYSLNGDENKYNELVRSFVTENSSNPEALNSLAWEFVQNVTDIQKLRDAQSWIKQAIAIDNNYAYNDTFAWLLYKEKNYKQALETAEKAILLAKVNNEDFSETTKLIEKIKTVIE